MQKLKEDHERLKRLVVTIVDAARVDDLARLNAAIIDAGRATGLDITHLVDIDTRPTRSLARVKQSTISLDDARTPQTFPHPPEGPMEVPPYDSQTGRMSPRWGYGVWLDPDRFLKIFQPPIDIVPYLGAGKHTVAGHIVWACLDYAYACLLDAMRKHIATSSGIPPGQGSGSDHYPHSLPPNSAARALFDHSLRHSKPLHDVAYIAALLEARMEFRRMGYMRADNPGANAESREMLQRRVFEDFEKRGVRMDQWWSALDVQKYIGQKMEVCEFAAFQAALRCEQEAQIQLLRPLARTLAQSGVCFGDGPRWRADHVVMVVNAWARAVSDQRATRELN